VVDIYQVEVGADVLSEFHDICKFTINHSVMLEMRDRPHIKFSTTASLDPEREIVLQFVDPDSGLIQMQPGKIVDVQRGHFAHTIQSIHGYSGCQILDRYRPDVVIGIHKGVYAHHKSNCGLEITVNVLTKLNELVKKPKNM
jgi:hypothetical protein